MENNEIVLDDLTRDLFGIPDSIHGEMLIDWLKREVEIIKNKLINRGYKDVGNHGFGMIYFSKDRFTYAIWPEDQENCQYGISKIEGVRYSQDSIQQHVFHQRLHKRRAGVVDDKGARLLRRRQQEDGRVDDVGRELHVFEEDDGGRRGGLLHGNDSVLK